MQLFAELRAAAGVERRRVGGGIRAAVEKRMNLRNGLVGLPPVCSEAEEFSVIWSS